MALLLLREQQDKEQPHPHAAQRLRRTACCKGQTWKYSVFFLVDRLAVNFPLHMSQTSILAFCFIHFLFLCLHFLFSFVSLPCVQCNTFFLSPLQGWCPWCHSKALPCCHPTACCATKQPPPSVHHSLPNPSLEGTTCTQQSTVYFFLESSAIPVPT